MITLDLKTLNLPAGEHTIQTMAMKNGKAISCLSTGVSYTVDPEPSPGVVNKGDIIIMSEDGVNRRYRVLKCNGAIAEVFTFYGVSVPPMSCTFTNSLTDPERYYNNVLGNCDLKKAIIKSNICQNLYLYSDNSGDISDPDLIIDSFGKSYFYKKVQDYEASEHYCYLLSLDDIRTYFNNQNFTGAQLNELLFGISTKSSTSSCRTWLRTYCNDPSISALLVRSHVGDIVSTAIVNTRQYLVAFTVDLSKVSWTKEE